MTNKDAERARQTLWRVGAFAALMSTVAMLYGAPTGPTPEDLRARVNGVRSLSSLTEPGLKPWHLKASFQFFDGKGQPTESGSLEEWWAGPTQWRVQVTSPSYTSLLTTDGDNTYRTAGTATMPAAVGLLLRQFTDPAVAQARVYASHPSLEQKTFGKAKLDCIMLAPGTVKSAPFGLYPTDCFDPGTSMLRVAGNYGSQVIVRNRAGHFQNKEVALDVAVEEGGVLSSRGQVEQLTTFAPQAGEFAPTAAQQALAGGGPPDVPAGAMVGMLVKKVTPMYPEAARRGRISGAVVLRALIGSDGHIEDLEPVSSPDDLLTTAAVAAVRQWTYKPYLLNGEPVEIKTTITVHFNIG